MPDDCPFLGENGGIVVGVSGREVVGQAPVLEIPDPDHSSGPAGDQMPAARRERDPEQRTGRLQREHRAGPRRKRLGAPCQSTYTNSFSPSSTWQKSTRASAAASDFFSS